MPLSKIKPEDTFAAFHTKETFTAVAHRLGVVRLTLQRWWIKEFGEEAFRQRVTHTKVTPEERNATRRAHREANGDRIRAQKKEWYRANVEKMRPLEQAHRKANVEHYRDYNKSYYAAHAETFRERAKQYRVENKEAVRQNERAAYQKHPERLLLKGARQRARRFNLPISITIEDVKGCIPANNCCPITQLPFERGEGKVGPRSMTLDRIIPDRGYVPGNIAVISHHANTIKQNCTDPAVFRRLADFLERASI